MDVNRATLVGRLTRDPESRVTPNGVNVTSFSVATNFVYKNQNGEKVEQVEYHNIVTWRKLAEIAAQYLKRGQRVLIEGRLQTRSWEANDGTKRQRTEIVGDNLIMLDRAGQSTANRDDSQSQPSPTEEMPSIQAEPAADQAGSPSPQQQPKPKAGSDDISVEDIPF
jgi:single-strand DNA-binding protein